MPIAGKFAPSSPEREREVRLSLERLRYASDTEAPQCASGSFATLGATATAQLYSGANCLVVFEGVLYRRAELAATLQLSDIDMLSDAALAGEAYLRWGEIFADRLYGEFSCAVYDIRLQRAVLTRDALGRSPLFWAAAGQGVAFASELLGLRKWAGVQDAISDLQVAKLFTLQYDPGATLFRDIRNLPGGHALILERDRAPRQVRYWNPAGHVVRSSASYAEGLRAAIWDAVEVRLPASGLVASQLSSGFDSSGVTALAAQILERQNRSLIAYTSVPAHQGIDASQRVRNRFADEWPLAAQVAAMYPNVEHVPVPTDGADWWESIDTYTDSVGAPPAHIRNGRWLHGIYHDARERGARVMLEGQAGNLTSSYDGGFGLYDLRKRGHWTRMVRSLLMRRRRTGLSWPALINSAWMPSTKTLARVQRLRRKPLHAFHEHTLVRADFYASTGLTSLDYSPISTLMTGDRTNGTTWRRSILENLDLGSLNAGTLRSFGVLRADPLADRRLVEFVYSIPDDDFAPAGKPRDLYRMAMCNDLPAELLNHRMRGLQSTDFLEMFGENMPAWYAELERLEASPRVARVLDLPRMRAALDGWPNEQMTPSARDTLYNFTFGGAMAIGRFLRRLDSTE